MHLFPRCAGRPGQWIQTVVLAATLAVAAVPATAQEDKTLAIGIVPIAPFGGSPPNGFFFELMNAVADKEGLRVDYRPMPFGELMAAVASGSIDVAAGPLTPFPGGRGQGLAYTGPVIMVEEAMIVPKNDTTAYTSMGEFAGKPVGALDGVTVYLDALKAAGVTDIRTYKLPAEAAAALGSGEIAAFFQGKSQFAYAQEVQGLFPDVRIVDTYRSVIRTPAALVVRADSGLVGPLHAAIEELKRDGTITTLATEWRQTPVN